MERSVKSRGTTRRNYIHPHNLFENEMITQIKHFKRQRKKGAKEDMPVVPLLSIECLLTDNLAPNSIYQRLKPLRL